jgi:hypothetical protein
VTEEATAPGNCCKPANSAPALASAIGRRILLPWQSRVSSFCLTQSQRPARLTKRHPAATGTDPHASASSSTAWVPWGTKAALPASRTAHGSSASGMSSRERCRATTRRRPRGNRGHPRVERDRRRRPRRLAHAPAVRPDPSRRRSRGRPGHHGEISASASSPTPPTACALLPSTPSTLSPPRVTLWAGRET